MFKINGLKNLEKLTNNWEEKNIALKMISVNKNDFQLEFNLGF